ncbi:exostosin family protein [Oceanicaulis sp. HTCC2633]|uniref:exostosin domain-containing protein n=1 Tax=Oceanicaulis sp. HTCC2633 TaxID=314254 RepID=UPI0002E417D1|nr:exostosin family protein [Oceanicaulis sp. HTCC2633]
MNISLFMPYFKPKEEARAEELKLCLERNRENKAISHIYLMVDDDAQVDTSDGRVTVLRLDRRPTYQDWTAFSEERCPDHISVLANADIYFDDTLLKLEELFAADPLGFVALTRYELVNDGLELHPNPHWSQDTWAYLPSHASNPDRDRCLSFPLGVPRCDNKVAYTFAVYGHKVYNPCVDVRSVHVHQTGIRTYDKKGDARIVGGMAMVHASEGLLDPAPLNIEMWPIQSSHFSDVKINSSLERWAKERGEALPRIQSPAMKKAIGSIIRDHEKGPGLGSGLDHEDKFEGKLYCDENVIGFDDHWQHPAVTEQHAFNQVRLLALRGSSTAYLGFPWATLIDVSNHNKSDLERLSELREGLSAAAEKLRDYDRVVTTCQHIHMLKFAELFVEAGVTDVFWSHATHAKLQFGDSQKVSIHPFPLYPVQVAENPNVSLFDRKYLFSFVGARSTPIYLTQSRTYIIEELSNIHGGYVVDRESWHYNKVVYDQQILKRHDAGSNLIDVQATKEFKNVMSETQFALCPSGTGPNSIRLWEAVASGAIPVVLADTYKAPGSQFIWDNAVVACPEDRYNIRKLPQLLKEIISDREEMKRKVASLSMIKARYGKSNFVPDILALLKPCA